MCKKLGLLLLLVLGINISAQITFINAPYDIGVVTAAGSDYLDIPIKNTSKQKVYVFRTDADKRFQIEYSSKTILPDSTIYMRVLFTPDKKGHINESLDIHFSCYDVPQKVKFTGFVETIPTSNAIACPSFDQQRVSDAVTFDFTVKVVDAVTGKLLPESTVELIKNGMLKEILDTKSKGFVERKLEIGYYYFVANNPAYESNELGTYVNRKNNIVIIPLTRKQEEIAAVEPEKVEEVIPEEIKEVVEEIVEEVKIEEPILVITEQEKNPTEVESTEELYPSFSLKDYGPNNIVFLLDVSSSMNQSGKLDLLKAAMIELSNILRPVDKITIVTYSTNANVILETTSGADKDSIISIIESLKASGITAGGKGMELAYAKASSSFISNGNNQIIMATDGLFNSGQENVYKLAQKYNKKGVKVSVIGIKNQTSHEQYMKTLSDDGGGTYTNVENYSQAKNTLVEEIKNQSRILP